MTSRTTPDLPTPELPVSNTTGWGVFPDQKIDRFPYLVFATYRRYDLRIHHRKYSSGLKSETLFCDEVLAYNFFRLVSRPHKARKNPPSRRKSIFNLPVRVGR